MSDYLTSARAALAVAFPPALGMKGALTTLTDLCRCAYRLPEFKARAVTLCIARNFEHAEGYGHGNAAKRRHRAIIAQNQGRSDRQQNVAAIAAARAEYDARDWPDDKDNPESIIASAEFRNDCDADH